MGCGEGQSARESSVILCKGWWGDGNGARISVCDPLGALHLHSVKSQPSNFEAFAWEIAGSALLKANEIDEAAGDLR